MSIAHGFYSYFILKLSINLVVKLCLRLFSESFPSHKATHAVDACRVEGFSAKQSQTTCRRRKFFHPSAATVIFSSFISYSFAAGCQSLFISSFIFCSYIFISSLLAFTNCCSRSMRFTICC